MCRITEVKDVYQDLTMVETKRKIHRSTLIGMLMRCDDQQLLELREDAQNNGKKLLLRMLAAAEHLKTKGTLPLGARPDKVA